MNRRSWVEISRSRIRSNWGAVARLVGPGVEVCPVVKADAYGHGAVEVSRQLAEEGPVGWLAVSSVEEGVALREAGIRAPRILVMAGVLAHEHEPLTAYRLTPVAHSLDDVAALAVGYHLKLDSGMSRLGTRAAAREIAAAIHANPRARCEGLMTHFASAADYVSTQTDEQCDRFDALRAELQSLGVNPGCVHMASTIAVAYGRRRAWKNLVRVGHAIYGYVSAVRAHAGGSAPPCLLDVEPALAWRASLVAVKEVPAGSRIGYGAMFTAPRPMQIGIVGAGYADGIPHRLSNKGRFIAAGHWAPILGAVSMDLTTIDLTDAPRLQRGDAVTILGREGDLVQDARQLARVAGTISYSVLCGISPRVHRVWID